MTYSAIKPFTKEQSHYKTLGIEMVAFVVSCQSLDNVSAHTNCLILQVFKELGELHSPEEACIIQCFFCCTSPNFNHFRLGLFSFRPVSPLRSAHYTCRFLVRKRFFTFLLNYFYACKFTFADLIHMLTTYCQLQSAILYLFTIDFDRPLLDHA